MNADSDDMKQFQTYREKLLDLMNEAQPLLNDTATLLGEDLKHYELPIERLKKNTFTLTLVGAFQSGKSTLFSYLCGGRELSPIGPGGGGIRTSGCRVTATALEDDGAKEYAVVSWRSKKDLVEPICSLLGVRADDYDLDDSKCRDELMEKLMSDVQSMVNTNNLELYRIALLVLQFYLDFKARITSGNERLNVEDAISIASYPQDWEPRWMKWTIGESVSSSFDASIIPFIFCSGVQYFIRSEHLKALQCTVVDCPGLFASEWDNKVAEQCIADSNAILYIFEGVKDLTQNDVEILKRCIELGGRDRIFFGANVKVPYSEWKRIEQLGVLPKLQQHGFKNPVVHSYHAALALRSIELSLEQNDRLSKSTRDAILISSEGESVGEYLKYRLNRFLLSALDQTLGDYTQQGEVNTSDIEIHASKVPDFIHIAQQKIVQDKAWSILVGNGTNRMTVILDAVERSATTSLKSMEKSCEDVKNALKDQENALLTFEEDVRRCTEALDAATHDGIRGIKDACRKVISEIVEGHMEDIIALTAEVISITWKCLRAAWNRTSPEPILETPESPTSLDRMAKLLKIGSYFDDVKRTFRRQYLEKLNAKLVDLLVDVRDHRIREEFTKWEEFTSIKTRFDYWRGQMLDKVKKLEGLPELDDNRLHLGEHFGEQELQRMQIKGIKGSIGEKTLNEELPLFFRWPWSPDAKAREFCKKHKGELISVMEDGFLAMMEAEGPLRAIMDYLEEFKDTFRQPRQFFERRKGITERMLHDTEEQHYSLRAALGPRLEQLGALKKKAAEFTEVVSDVYKH